MRMKHRLRLLVLTAVLVAAPASVARVAASPAYSHDGDCPYEEQARLAAAGYEMLPTVTEGDPAEGSLFDPGRRSVFAP